MQSAREEIGEMMVKILREGAQLGDVRRQRGIGSENEAPASLRSDSGRTVGGEAGFISEWEKLSQWDPARGSFAGSNRGSFGESSKRSERRGERQEGKRRYRSPWVKSKIW